MATFIRQMFGAEPSMGRKSGSFNDFSLHAGDDAERDFDSSNADQQQAPEVKENSRPRRANVWQDTFSPGMNANMKAPGASFYDSPPKNEAGKSKSVWEHILKADFVRHATFNEFDVNKDGMIDASDLRTKLGPDANVEALIKQADRNGDGKISQSEFCELLKQM